MKYTVKDILKIQVAPALGCTEPVAIALGAAAAAALLPGEEITGIEVSVDPNIYKNGMAVSIPGSGGLSGLDTAAALGLFGGDPTLRLEVLETVDEEAVARALDFIRGGHVKVNLLSDRRGLFIKSVVRAGKKTAESVIRNIHDNIVSLTLDGEAVETVPYMSDESRGADTGDLQVMEDWLKERRVSELLDLAGGMDSQDRAFIKEGVTINLRLADYGLKHGSGLGVGRTLERLVRQKLI
ncbi:MAG TPA: serine dehydratase subunit alpha family protein, partial [Chromatiaceae bacterium]|nr:serine dehydratase subunit alpha family protein [Chromatiaceae bacterium]